MGADRPCHGGDGGVKPLTGGAAGRCRPRRPAFHRPAFRPARLPPAGDPG